MNPYETLEKIYKAQVLQFGREKTDSMWEYWNTWHSQWYALPHTHVLFNPITPGTVPVYYRLKSNAQWPIMNDPYAELRAAAVNPNKQIKYKGYGWVDGCIRGENTWSFEYPIEDYIIRDKPKKIDWWDVRTFTYNHWDIDKGFPSKWMFRPNPYSERPVLPDGLITEWVGNGQFRILGIAEGYEE